VTYQKRDNRVILTDTSTQKTHMAAEDENNPLQVHKLGEQGLLIGQGNQLIVVKL